VNGYHIIASHNGSTVVAEYSSVDRSVAEYQSEAALEKEFIRLLGDQGYEYIKVHDETALIENLRTQLESLNDITFSDSEWSQFYDRCIASTRDGIIGKTHKIQEDFIQLLKRDDGTTKNIYLIDKINIHNNRLQVINQYEETQGTHATRYDVTILVNGLPLVHIELKRRGVAIHEAFNQIKRYQRDSFWASSGLYEYVQIFVISNGTHTKYYSNTTRDTHIKDQKENRRKRGQNTSNSFEFTSYWADSTNKVIDDLVDFTRTFFAKHTLLNILTRFCVFTSEQKLLVMRPYQIVATEKILSRIVTSTQLKKTGSTEAGGYIWHTTGSGKTLTSFKTAQLATQIGDIDKVLFVVDRKDLDYQTMKEYDRFKHGCANSNRTTSILQQQLGDPNVHIIITTIQKLDIFVRRNKEHEIYHKHIVIIFDECHRSQFGDMHQKIIKAFRNYHIFGFTGTPIFAVNASLDATQLIKTTEQAFGEQLHTYTIVDAINDGNVLPFRIDFINTIKKKDEVAEKQVKAIDVDKAMSDPERVSNVVEYITEHFPQKTFSVGTALMPPASVGDDGIRPASAKKTGFNSIFATDSISMAKIYYTEFKKQYDDGKHSLKVATIFSYSPNEATPEDILPDEEFENERLDKGSRDFLENAIADYNAMFITSFNTSSEAFQSYYKDVSKRMKSREIDILIVVNMFLTGFDATTLNTLWCDKNLRLHGLIQAFSRTNRILNSVKTFGNIVCFRDLTEATDKAIALFGDKDAGGIVLLKTFEDYYNGYVDDKGKHHKGYTELIEELLRRFPLGGPIIGEEAQKDFIGLYGRILRLRNILIAFDDFAGKEILTQRELQDFQSVYIDLYEDMRSNEKAEKENINDDIVFEMELIKQIEVNIDYILILVEKYHASNCKDKNILTAIDKAINSSVELRSKKELIERFLSQVNVSAEVSSEWQRYVIDQKDKDLAALIADENLKDEETRQFINRAFRDGILKTTGMEIDRLLPPMSRFGSDNRAKKKQGILDKLMVFFGKYLGLVREDDDIKCLLND